MESFCNFISDATIDTKRAVFNKLIANTELDFLKDLCKGLDKAIANKVNEIKNNHKTADVNDFVTYEDSYLPSRDSVDHKNLMNDLESVDLKTKYDGVKTAWLTTTNEPYNWDSSQGTIENDPQNINNCTSIKNIMDNLNTKMGLKLNSCLVSLYSDEGVNQRLHADNEATLDQSQPICIVSVGATRPIQFYRKKQSHEEPTHHTVILYDGSLCCMMSGCQQYFKHRVPPGTDVGLRYSLSFRRIHMKATPRTPVKDLVAFLEDSATTNSSTDIGDNSTTSPPPEQSKVPLTTVIFGTSITTKLDPKRLARGKRTCINKSVSGATISSITKNLEEFFEAPETKPDDIEKVIYSLGTNDIRFRKGVYYLNNSIKNLIYKTRVYFKHAQIYFQSVLPIKISKYFHASNFLQFNKMLMGICVSEKCSYIDVFREYLDPSGYDCNMYMYNNDGLHLNHRGIVRLAYHMRYVINMHTFNPRVY